jgi:hypothetical protein
MVDFLGQCPTLQKFTSFQSIFILLHCEEAVNCLAYDYNKHLNKMHFLLHDTQVADKALGPLVSLKLHIFKKN